MYIKVYIEPGGEVTITTLVGDLVPLAYALDRTDRQMRRWLDFSSQPAQGGSKRGETVYGSIAACQPMESQS